MIIVNYSSMVLDSLKPASLSGVLLSNVVFFFRSLLSSCSIFGLNLLTMPNPTTKLRSKKKQNLFVYARGGKMTSKQRECSVGRMSVPDMCLRPETKP